MFPPLGGDTLRRGMAVIIVTLALGIASMFSVSAQIEFTEYVEGEWAKYEFWTDYRDQLLTGEVKVRVTGESQVSGHDVFVVRYKGEGTYTGIYSGTWKMEFDYFQRASDHATVKEEGSLTVHINMIGEKHILESKREVYYTPPLDLNDYPIEMGETWNASARESGTSTLLVDGVVDSVENIDENVVYTVECIREVTVTVPAGTFQGWELKATRDDGSYKIHVLSQEVNAVVLDEDFESDGRKSGSMELKSYGIGDEEGIPFWMWLLVVTMVVAVVVIIGISMAVRRTRKKEEDDLSTIFDHEEEPPPWR